MSDPQALIELAGEIKRRAGELGFQQAGIAGIELPEAERELEQWLALGYHGDMDYMARHGRKRSRPTELVPGTLRVISLRLDYLPEPMSAMRQVLDDPRLGYVARYALGRDYHKLLRQRMKPLLALLRQARPGALARSFVDSAPVLEKPLAREAGLGWQGRHTNLLNRRAGSWFFLGEIYTDLPLPVDAPASAHCGRCRACLAACPTGALIAPHQLDARRCIAYLTIEAHGPIPLALRPLLGNRIYGCDDCQLVCPWNRFARQSRELDLQARHGLDRAPLTELFAWSEADFLRRTEGSPLRRLGHARWLRNLAVALGNGPPSSAALEALRRRVEIEDELVREHVIWALERLRGKAGIQSSARNKSGG